MHRYVIRALTIMLICIASGYGEDVNDRVKATDMKDPEAVFELAIWCADNNQPSTARRYYNQVIRLDPDHWGAREALGQVKVNDRWVSARLVDAQNGGNAGDAGGSGSSRKASGPGPKASDIEWNLTPLKDPRPEFAWINQYVDRMNTVGNDSRDMDVSVATILAADHLGVGLARLSVAMVDPKWTDVYGPSMLAMELMRTGNTPKAKRLLPFMAKASERTTNEEDLYTFAFVTGGLKDKRIVPRLIELLGNSSDTVQDGARDGLAQLTMLPRNDITVEAAQKWWDLNHSIRDEDIFREQLQDKNDAIALEAAKALYEYRDKSIVPVLARLMNSSDRNVRSQSIFVVQQITGTDWSYKVDGDPASWKERSKELADWWKQNEFLHTWIEDQGNATVAGGGDRVDPYIEKVAKLGSVSGNEAASAESALLGGGNDAIPALLAGLNDSNRIVRRKAFSVLTSLTKHNLPYEAGADDATRQAQIAAWTTWLTEQGRMPNPAGEGAAPVP